MSIDVNEVRKHKDLSDEGSKDKNYSWYEGALIVASLTALVFLMGFLREFAYYRVLGIPLHDIRFPIEHFMMQSYDVLWGPAALFVSVYAVDRFGAAVKRIGTRQDPRAEGPGEKLYARFSGPAVAAFCAIVAFLLAWERMNIELWSIPGTGVSVIDLVVFGFMATIATGIYATQRRGSNNPFYPLLGRTDSANLFLTLLAISMLSSAAALTGGTEASDQAWGCVSLPMATFEPPQGSLLHDHRYWLVLHTNGEYFVRDAGLPGNVKNYIVIQAQNFSSASVSWQEPLNTC